MKISFDNRTTEKTYLSWLFYNSLVKAALPKISANFDTPIVVYILNNPIGFKLFNFHKFVNNFDVNAFLDDESTLPCGCAGSPFVDRYHNHITLL